MQLATTNSFHASTTAVVPFLMTVLQKHGPAYQNLQKTSEVEEPVVRERMLKLMSKQKGGNSRSDKFFITFSFKLSSCGAYRHLCLSYFSAIELLSYSYAESSLCLPLRQTRRKDRKTSFLVICINLRHHFIFIFNQLPEHIRS